MSTLIVKLPSPNGTMPPDGSANASAGLPMSYDFVLSHDGRNVASQSRASAQLLPRVPNGEVVALVGAECLSWHRVTLPRGTLARQMLQEPNPARLRAILEGLLEDHLLDDPARLHFALGPEARDDAPVWVGVCDRAWLHGMVQALEQQQVQVARIAPEFAPLDAGAAAEAADPALAHAGSSLQVLGTPDAPQMVFPRNGAPQILPLSAAAVVLAAWPSDAAVVAEPAVAALAEGLFNRRVSLQQVGQRWLAASQSNWDLAQFDLVNSSSSRTFKQIRKGMASLAWAPRWRAARWALVALAVANLAGLNAWAWAQTQSVQAKRAAIDAVLTSTFPQVKVVVDAPLQMAREVALLRQATGGASSSDFDQLLTTISANVPMDKAYTAIEYAANEIRIKGHGLSPAQLDAVRPVLAGKGLQAQLDADFLRVQATAP